MFISDIRIWVHLGCSNEEKFHPQLISINIEIQFHKCPYGAKTDSLQDTICYMQITQMIIKCCEKQAFNLIESLTKFIHSKVIESINDYNKSIIYSITTELHKISPPVPGIHGGVKWTHQTIYEKGNL